MYHDVHLPVPYAPAVWCAVAAAPVCFWVLGYSRNMHAHLIFDALFALLILLPMVFAVDVASASAGILASVAILHFFCEVLSGTRVVLARHTFCQ